MKRYCLSILLVSAVFFFVPIIDTVVLAYTVSPYTQYASPTSSGQMTMDDAGNLYVAHYDDGKIMKIDSSGQSTVFASGLGNLNDIIWSGGTAYGNYLYATSPTSNTLNDKLYRIDTNGSSQSIAMSFPNQQPCAIGIDRFGNYNSQLFVGTSAVDRINAVSVEGVISTFSTWPGQINGGGVYGLSFDPSGKYNHMMYLTTIFSAPQNANVSGLFMMNPNGTVSRFAADLVAAGTVDFDPAGTYFDNDMFVTGRTNVNDPLSLWRVFADGSCEEFMTNVGAFTFGSDGAMYVSHYNWGTSAVTISRVIPEPATLLLLAAGGLVLRKRKA